MTALPTTQHHACGPMQSLHTTYLCNQGSACLAASRRVGLSARTCMDSPSFTLGLQVGFKKTLTKEVTAFATDAKAFRANWQANGPMVPGLAPLEAVERLKKFQQMFDVRALLTASYGYGGANKEDSLTKFLITCCRVLAIQRQDSRLLPGQLLLGPSHLLTSKTGRCQGMWLHSSSKDTQGHSCMMLSMRWLPRRCGGAGAGAQVGLLLQGGGAVWAAGHPV